MNGNSIVGTASMCIGRTSGMKGSIWTTIRLSWFAFEPSNFEFSKCLNLNLNSWIWAFGTRALKLELRASLTINRCGHFQNSLRSVFDCSRERVESGLGRERGRTAADRGFRTSSWIELRPSRMDHSFVRSFIRLFMDDAFAELDSFVKNGQFAQNSTNQICKTCLHFLWWQNRSIAGQKLIHVLR